ncbi:XdhC family protein [Desulfovibrio sp.]|uniref:XdhC family protein n=1 Tax=Desulfovibrio sp. TaxID=885 RepID=UPI0023D58B51|nr:XdhC family protein [Desulfovibrio sp.]MDE7241877.1 XdhC family protein [Desulfovibrio sp.]
MASVEKHPLLDGGPLSLTPTGAEAADGADVPVLLLLGDGPVARALGRLAAECGFAVDMALWEAAPPPEADAGDGTSEDASGSAPDIPGLRRYIRLLPDEGAVERCAVGRRHYVCIFPGDEAAATRALEDVLASHAFFVGLWATRAERERIWAALRGAGVPDAELAAVRCPLGLGDLDDMGGPAASAVPVLAELLAARAGGRQRGRLED